MYNKKVKLRWNFLLLIYILVLLLGLKRILSLNFRISL